jgi:hypothetical protein
MFLRFTTRKKDGKEHRYYSVVESVRSSGNASPHQRTVLYLGEINSHQQAQWAKAIEVFDTQSCTQESLALYPADRPVPADLACGSVSININLNVLASTVLVGSPASCGAASS